MQMKRAIKTPALHPNQLIAHSVRFSASLNALIIILCKPTQNLTNVKRELRRRSKCHNTVSTVRCPLLRPCHVAQK